MPAYPWLADRKAKDSVAANIDTKMAALNKVGLPKYSAEEIAGAKAAVGDLSEMQVLVAYLQGLGLALKNTK